MMSKTPAPFRRPIQGVLENRLSEPRRFIQVVAGPRQVGKTTAVLQVLDARKVPHWFASADEPTLRGDAWIEAQWDAARLAASRDKTTPIVLVLDEVQKIPAWSETVKRLWDEEKRTHGKLRVLLLGSSALLVQRGLTEH